MADHHHSSDTHIVGYGQHLLTWFGLIALTGITVALAGIDLGSWVIITALTIASIKTVLVLNIFMHLKFESRTLGLIALTPPVLLVMFVCITYPDIAWRLFTHH